MLNVFGLMWRPPNLEARNLKKIRVNVELPTKRPLVCPVILFVFERKSSNFQQKKLIFVLERSDMHDSTKRKIRNYTP